MIFDWDPAKAAANLAKHGVAFEAVEDLDFSVAVFRIDGRQSYGETREIAYAPLADRLHVLVFTRRGDAVRVISLRKANSREIDMVEAARHEEE